MEKKMENEMETGIILGLYWDYIGIMENKMDYQFSVLSLDYDSRKGERNPSPGFLEELQEPA